MLKKPSRKQAAIIGAAALVVVIVGGVFIKGAGSAKAETKTVLPSVTQIMNGDIDERVTASGTVQAADEYSIFIELSQEVKEVYAEVGDEVKEGDLLVTYEIDDTKKELENKVKQAEITLENAQLTLSELIAPTEETELIDLQNQVLSAEKTLSETEKTLADTKEDISELEQNLSYYKELYDIGSISKQEYDDYNKEYETLLADKAQLEKDVESCKLSLEKTQINLSNGQTTLATTSEQNSYKKQLNSVETAKMDLETAEESLEQSKDALELDYISLNIIMGVDVDNRYSFEMPVEYEVMEEPANLDNYIDNMVNKNPSVLQQENNYDLAIKEFNLSTIYSSEIGAMASGENSINSAEMSLNDTKDNIYEQYLNLYDSIRKYESAYEAAVKELTVLKSKCEAARLNYESGKGSLKDYETAKTDVEQQENTIISTLYDHALAVEKFENPNLM